MLSSCEEVQNLSAAGWLEKEWINSEANILPTGCTGKSSALAIYHNMGDLMLQQTVVQNYW